MSTPAQMPTLHFFRCTPLNMQAQPPLASSLQSLETTFFLLSLDLYPSALVSCATAWESAVKAKLGLLSDDKVPLAESLKKVRELSPELKAYDQSRIDAFRKRRNEMVHYGYSPNDDVECARLIVDTGLPFLCSLYKNCFDFYVDWHELGLEFNDFEELSATHMAKPGLIPEFANQFRIMLSMYSLNRSRDNFNPTFCFTAFSHLIRVRMKMAATSTAEERLLIEAESQGMKYHFEEEEKERLARELNYPTWEFSCPICHECKSIVAEVDEQALDRSEVSLRSCICVSCHLVVPRAAFQLANLLLRAELIKETPLILAQL